MLHAADHANGQPLAAKRRMPQLKTVVLVDPKSHQAAAGSEYLGGLLRCKLSPVEPVPPVVYGKWVFTAAIEAADWPLKVIILTTFDPDEYVYRALRAGASGFVLKDIRPEDLAPAVRTVADGGALLDPSITRRLIERFAQTLEVDTATARRLEALTDRERDVLIELAKGSSNAEISDILYIGAATVKSHVSSILTKVGLRDRAQAVVFAYESGLTTPGHFDIGH